MQLGLNSPWGILHQIIKETGWSLHYVLWKINRANIMLMMADQSNVTSIKPGEEEAIPQTGKDLAARFNNKKQQ